MLVRPAEASDARDIRSVHLLAFPSHVEADLVEQLVSDGDSLISLVAIERARIVGHILFSRMDARSDGRRLDALGLGPVAIIPEMQRRGIGSALIEAGIAEARRLGAKMIFVLGDNMFYERFGFAAAAAQPFDCRYSGPHFQALALDHSARPPLSGTAGYARAFDRL